ncbi:MAG: hypothetical protein MUO82_11350 [Candidatus Thermoplasmatota archaeon]|nr:hypothetical protein [Candidatus Thermoplasmatota archaeon]
MKGRTIIFGSIIACFLMLLVPNISAIEFRSIKDNATDYNEKELIDAIKERIEQLKVQNPDPKMTFKGGLDDIYDWVDLFFGLTFGHELVKMFKSQWLRQAFATGNILFIALTIILYGLYTHSTITKLGDAFDIIDPDNNGY